MTAAIPVTVALAGVGRVVAPEIEAILAGSMLVTSYGQMATDSAPRRSECVTQQPAKLLDAVEVYVVPTNSTEQKPTLARRVSRPLPSSSMHAEERRSRGGVLDNSPVVVNWSGLDPPEQAEITPTLASTDNWIIFTHPLDPEKTITPPRQYGPQGLQLYGETLLLPLHEI